MYGAFLKEYTDTFVRVYNTKGSFIGTYLKTYTKNYDQLYQGVYTKAYQKAYEGTFNQDYLVIYNKDYAKAYVGPVFYGGFASGSQTTTYNKAYTKGYEKNWIKTYTGIFTKDYEKAYTGDYTKSWTKDYVKTFEDTAYSREVNIAYLGFAETTGVAGSGGAGWNIGEEGITEADHSHMLFLPQEGNLINGGSRGVPDWEYGNSRAIGGKGGDLGNVGTGGGERFLRKSRLGRSGDGGKPGAAIKGYDSDYVNMIYQGNILGDPNYMFQG